MSVFVCIGDDRYCTHGYSRESGCFHCAEEHKNNLIRSQHEHLIEHAQDGIEKCFERIEKLEKFHEEFKNVLKKDIKDHQEMHDSLENKVKKLELSQVTKALDPQVWVHVHERLDKLEGYMQMEDRITVSDVLLRLDELDRLIKIQGDVLRKNKLSPHKCPVCDGKPLVELRITTTVSGNDKLLIECHACEGKGIVWSE